MNDITRLTNMRLRITLIPAILAGAGILARITDLHGLDYAAKRTGMIIQTNPYTYSEEQLA